MPPRRRLAAVPDRPTRVVLYIRVSALMGRGGDDFHSPDVQTSAMRRATTGMTEVAVIDDIDVSGTHFSREGIDRVRALARTGQLDAIAVYDVSRFGRDVLESLLILRELSQSGVRIISACEQIDTSSPAGEMMLINLLNVAQYRAREIGRSWSNAIARRAETGKHHGRPLGYVKREKRLVPDPVVGPAIAEAFRRYAAGEPIGEVTAYLAAARGATMVSANVKKMLRNPSYLGQVVAGDQVYPGEHDPLVDADTWQRVQDRLTEEAGTAPRVLQHTWPMVGITECPRGHSVQRQGDRLMCIRQRSDIKGQEACPGIGRPLLALVEAETLRQVAEYAARLCTDAGQRAARMARITATRGDRDRLERQLQTVRAGMVRVTTRNALEEISDEVYRQSLAELRASETALSGELARLGPVVDIPDPDVEAAAVSTLLVLWPKMTNAERKRALRTVVDRVVVRPTAYWREPEKDRVKALFRW
ncbi:recombinase family protein [Micromonospora sp. RTGN7]|uniref:recombinase family protein n=1 Tax=Micromonospora sp. RTGN7 TaxID=3016526 RepID=UPI0029FF2618|nr:recombinase family protein [Micromonospora sp. RTGN7]